MVKKCEYVGVWGFRTDDGGMSEVGFLRRELKRQKINVRTESKSSAYVGYRNLKVIAGKKSDMVKAVKLIKKDYLHDWVSIDNVKKVCE